VQDNATVFRCPLGLHVGMAELASPEKLNTKLAATIVEQDYLLTVANSVERIQSESDEEADEMCYICHEFILTSGNSFGIQENCAHPFCWQCICNWRNQGNNLCPVCRLYSGRILLWPKVIRSQADRTQLCSKLSDNGSDQANVSITIASED